MAMKVGIVLTCIMWPMADAFSQMLHPWFFVSGAIGSAQVLMSVFSSHAGVHFCQRNWQIMIDKTLTSAAAIYILKIPFVVR